MSQNNSYEVYAKVRDGKGLTDYAVAKETGIATATFTNWKQNMYTPKADSMIKIASFLQMDPMDLIGANVCDN